MSAEMARRYEAAWNKLFYELPDWKQKFVIEEPNSRHAGELARDAARLAEDMNITFKVPATGAN
tara:strand:- start:433 stop:624 length:192 start_codon:yes stop_codon:yes gene_type:complete